jgi:hypothetical protein
MALRKMMVNDKIGHWDGRFPRYVSRSEGRTRAAGRANARCRTVERGLPDGRTHVAARSNTETGPGFARPNAETGRGFPKPLILFKAGLQNPGIFSSAPFRGPNSGPRSGAKYLNGTIRVRG